ncbi:cytochrome P450 [Sphingobium sp. Z007]|uniref:cytochrome P450 n=1 Tax=Sphingobium sp. Z007 TaxID=627495 RepID=UPI000B49CF8A|nr:cytochrome P450 [Sphingobium sp. Z007]
MATSLDADVRPIIPDDIARIVIAPKSYTDDATIYGAFRWLREHMPLGIAQVPGYDPVWIVTKHADIKEVERNGKLFHNADHNPILVDQASDAFTRDINSGSIRILSSLTYMDPPEHASYRTLTSNWFLPGKISKLEDQIRVLARQSVDNLLSFDGECDFVRDFALHYPLRVIMTLFGVPPEDEPRMLKLTQEFFGVHDPEEQRPEMAADPVVAAKQWAASIEDFYTYFDRLSADRRERPTDDLLSLIANSRINGAPIPRDEANGYYVAIATAGHDTTSSSTAGGLHGMMVYPENWAKVKADPSLIPRLVDEAIRWTSPVKHFMRNATADTQVRGMDIRAMERLMICYPSGNRDEAVFEDADRFDVTRSPNPHIAFGFGPHMCLGQHLAKLEMRILFEELLPHLRSVEMAGDPRMVETNFVGGYKALPIRFTKN